MKDYGTATYNQDSASYWRKCSYLGETYTLRHTMGEKFTLSDAVVHVTPTTPIQSIQQYHQKFWSDWKIDDIMAYIETAIKRGYTVICWPTAIQAIKKENIDIAYNRNLNP